MKKNLLSMLLLFGFLGFSISTALAQQNQKIILPTPAGFMASEGLSVTPTSDGGFLLLGQVELVDWNTVGVDIRPRIAKLDANLNVIWDNLYVPPPINRGGLTYPQGDAFETADGDFVVGLHNDSSDVHLMQINGDGTLQYLAPVSSFQRNAQVLGLLPNGNTLLFEDSNTPSIRHFNPNGIEVYKKVLGLSGIEDAPIVLSNGDLLFWKFNFTEITRTDNQGNILWQIQPAGLNGVSGLVALPSGGFGISSYSFTTSMWRIRFFDDNGLETSISEDLPLPFDVSKILAYADGTFLASGKTATNRGYLTRFNADGTLIWSAESPNDGQPALSYLRGKPTIDGWGVGCGLTTSSEMGFMRVQDNSGFFANQVTGKVLFDANENCQVETGESPVLYAHATASNSLETFNAFVNGGGEYSFILPAGDFSITITPNEPFFFQCPTAPNSVSFAPNVNGSAVVDVPIQSLDLPHLIKGKVTLDQNNDCIADPMEPAGILWDLTLTFGTKHINLKTDNNGEYQIFVPSDDYTLEIQPWNANFAICGQAKRMFSLQSTDPLTQTEDFTVFADVYCPEMRLNIGSNTVRPCNTRVLGIYYQNQGTAMAEDQTIEITLDPGLEFQSANPMPSAVNGQKLTFEVGDVLPANSAAAWQTIDVTVLTSCNLQLGQQACISAAILDDSPCADPDSWQGAVITVEGECDNTSDSVFFKIRNIGNAPNVAPLDFIIDEDQIVLLQGNFQLPAGGEKTYGVLPMFDSTTVSIVAEQEPGAPGDTLVTFSLTNCTGFGGGTPGGLGGNSGPYSTTKCFLVVNSFDPNDKSAAPLGYGDQHLVRPGTPLDYTIRFQNTGNDTAYLVVLRDTLSKNMDRSKIEILEASHPYKLAQISDSILHFSFENILLPDSLTNPEGSQGFISFRIYPQADLPNGTVVHNQAAIYFDFNEPIITNDVWRTYGEYFLVSTHELNNGSQVRVNVSPNPFIEEATFELPTELPAGTYQLELFDAQGKHLRNLMFTGKTCQLRRNGLPTGIHFWNITESGKILASGKIVTEN